MPMVVTRAPPAGHQHIALHTCRVQTCTGIVVGALWRARPVRHLFCLGFAYGGTSFPSSGSAIAAARTGAHWAHEC